MADLNLVVAAVERAATKAGLVCDPERAQVVFVVEREIKNPGPMGNPQASLQVSLQSISDLKDGVEEEFASSLIAGVIPNLS